ncbi:MAG: tyrosine--tRNA ligase, partial [Candidatus Omnitrophica bacterium]|nr:tyrosine--tRNA ligase [Candidatus Omnitrophota bacterium]
IFNLLVGRDIQKDFGQGEQVVITMPLLEGTDGIQKMSKSCGNYIGINENPKEIFGKIMSISDAMMIKYYELLTGIDLQEVKAMHPKEAKMRLAEEIVSQYYSSKEAGAARQEFERVFSQKELPADMQVYKPLKAENVLNILLKSGLVKSGNEGRRLLKQGAVFFNEEKIIDEAFIPENEGILKVGSRRYLKIGF